jgi:phage virion morphogenesis protein
MSDPVEFYDSGLLRALEHLAALGEDQGPVLEEIGRQWKTKVQLSFQTSTDPWGEPWEPLKYRIGQPLRDTGHLMNSIDYRVEGDMLEVGTNYGQLPDGGSIAAVHQFGTFRAGRARNVRIPARPFFPISEYVQPPEEWAEDAIGAIVEAIDRAARSGG